MNRSIAPVARAAAAMLAFALPPRCPGCGEVTAEDHRFCMACWTRLDFLGPPSCISCAEPFEIDPGPGARCGACLRAPPALDSVRAAVAYGEIARQIAIRLKHGRRPGLSETIARQLHRLVTADSDMLVAPVPLHRWRIWSRGFNQSALIARALCRRRALPLAVDLIERTRRTPMLRGLGPAARAKAVRGAFAVRRPHQEALRGRRILLIDDVYTTGATANACAAALKRGGAAEVHLLCWARVVRGTSPSLDI
ncbi:MAG: ComF family protein [Sphingomonas bacterium]|nr:ComF family protein [Sphingomonas bacterium]